GNSRVLTDAAVALGDQTLKDQLARLARPPIISNTNWTSPCVADAAGVDLRQLQQLQSFLPPRFHRRRRTATNGADATQPAGRSGVLRAAAAGGGGNRAGAAESSSFARLWGRTSAEIHTTLTPRQQPPEEELPSHYRKRTFPRWI
uniref:Os06g0618700 protein n=1 Tax=Macrostomum lignano TaxID=282301 RepID=A0A1I8FPT1_9PLAT